MNMELIIGITTSLVGALSLWFIARYFYIKASGEIETAVIGQESFPVRVHKFFNTAPATDYIRLSHINVANSLPESVFGFRLAQLIVIALGLVSAVLIPLNMIFALLPIMFIGLGAWYMPQYCKGIVNERELEWYKAFNLYQEIALEAETDVMSSVFFRLEAHIKHKEVREGIRTILEDISSGGDRTARDYPFPIVQKLQQILKNLENGDSAAITALNEFYRETYRDYKFKINKILAQTANKAILATLPFLLVSLVVALLVPMIIQALGQ